MGFLRGFDRQILAALDSDNEDVSREALSAAGHRNLTEAGETLLAVAMDSLADRNRRLAAIGALAGVCPENSRELLTELSEDADQDIAAMAEYALAERDLFDPDRL